MNLPPPLPEPDAAGPAGDPRVGREGLSDRARSRSGLACVDCHRLSDAGPVRPAPDLQGVEGRASLWRGRAAGATAAIRLCAERYQARVISVPEAAALVAALARPPAAASPASDAYDQACRHCHEAGPAGPLLGRPWPHEVVRDQVRGRAGPKPPDRFMPRFAPAVLSEQALSAVLDRLDRAGRPRVGRGPDE
ncbi:MAG: c-type cytochrome [Myxococcales bacterium]|nr:c-type cytochrome [Myxococcales bacterium]